MTEEQLLKMLDDAKAATRGPLLVVYGAGYNQYPITLANNGAYVVATAQAKADARHIANMDPDTAADLIREVLDWRVLAENARHVRLQPSLIKGLWSLRVENMPEADYERFAKALGKVGDGWPTLAAARRALANAVRAAKEDEDVH